jgi:hypothetical protein
MYGLFITIHNYRTKYRDQNIFNPYVYGNEIILLDRRNSKSLETHTQSGGSKFEIQS